MCVLILLHCLGTLVLWMRRTLALSVRRFRIWFLMVSIDFMTHFYFFILLYFFLSFYTISWLYWLHQLPVASQLPVLAAELVLATTSHTGTVTVASSRTRHAGSWPSTLPLPLTPYQGRLVCVLLLCLAPWLT